MVRTIREERIWSTYGVPALWKVIFNVYRNQAGEVSKESFREFFGEQFRHGLIGGARVDEELRAFIASIDFNMGNAYGSTETLICPRSRLFCGRSRTPWPITPCCWLVPDPMTPLTRCA